MYVRPIVSFQLVASSLRSVCDQPLRRVGRIGLKPYCGRRKAEADWMESVGSRIAASGIALWIRPRRPLEVAGTGYLPIRQPTDMLKLLKIYAAQKMSTCEDLRIARCLCIFLLAANVTSVIVLISQSF